MDRRNFVKKTCSICMAISGAGIVLSQIESCGTPAAMVKTNSDKNKILIDITSLDASKPYYIVRDSNLEYDVLLLKKEEQYLAFYMQCTHENNPVHYNGNQFYCSAHNSKFDATGKPFEGPASQPLKQFLVTKKDNKIQINL